MSLSGIAVSNLGSYASTNTIYSSHVYPRTAANGSTVIIYGHETGLRVVWYAGKSFKPSSPSPKLNGKRKDEPEVIDLDDDSDNEAQHISGHTDADFEEAEQEVDPSKPYPKILRHLDIHVGTAATHIAQPEIDSARLDSDRYPALLQDRIVVAVACSDLAIRVITCPLTPPAPQVLAPSDAGIRIVKLQLGGVGFHQDLITSIAVTFSEEDKETIEVDDQSQSDKKNPRWSFLIASTSCTGSGLLLIHQIPVNEQLSANSQHTLPIRRVRPRIPLAEAKLSFNTCPPPADRHSTLLITVPDASCVKIYQVFSSLTAGLNHRGSAGTMESVSSRGSTHSTNLHGGKMLMTLAPEFAASSDLHPCEKKKKVLDAKWVMGGRAILALLEDGEFGIWDLEAVGPAASKTAANPIKGQSNIAGIVGAAVTHFSVASRFVVPQTSASQAPQRSRPQQNGLAPATPHTKKLRAEGLFKGSNSDISSDRALRFLQDGAITISSTSSQPASESAVLTFGSQILFIASVQSFWQSAATSGRGTLKAGSFNGPLPLPSLNLLEELVQGAELLPHFSSQTREGYGSRDVPNFVVSTNTRLAFFIEPLVEAALEPAAAESGSRSLALRSADDSLPLARHNLDVDAMDEILDNMQASRPATALGSTKLKPNFGKSVAFARDEEGDVDMASPSPAKIEGLSIMKSSGTQRRLFS